jgi:hypothetical protein
MEKWTIFTIGFWTGRQELSTRKNTNHVVLEGNHCLLVYAKKEACMCVAPVVCFLVEEMTLEPCEFFCENS